MRLHNQTSHSYLKALSITLSRDPASMENWNGVYIPPAEDIPYDLYEAVLLALKERHKEMDCDVFHCQSNDIFALSNSMPLSELNALSAELLELLPIEEDARPRAQLYDVFHDWREVQSLLEEKSSNSPSLALPTDNYNFGEVDSLVDVFAEAKKLRRSRSPQHVMIVEDDPLTRRIVSNSFKENYALISATDAREAVANYLVHAPDIVFLDIGLPDVSGFSVLKQIVANDPDAFVVMFSSNSYLDNITRAFGSGASGFIAKPFKKEKMRQYIHESALHHKKYA